MKPRSFLLIRLSSIGDVILTGSLVTELRARFPDARIDFLVLKENGDMIRFHPGLSETILLDKKSGKKGLETLKEELDRAGYDTVIDLQGSNRSRKLRRIPGAHVRVIHKHQLVRFLLVQFKINLYRKIYGKIVRVPEKYFLAAGEAGTFPERTDLFIPEESRKKGEELLSRYPAGVISMAPGAKHFTKRWPVESYAKLASLILERTEYGVVMVGGPDETGVIQQIQSLVPNHEIQSFASVISLTETIGVIGASKGFVSNDSSLMHGAAANRVPQVAIFGSTVEELGFFPVSPVAKVVEDSTLGCRPCTHLGRATCPRKHLNCLKNIDPEVVFRTLMELVES